jgi:hypothetical protein
MVTIVVTIRWEGGSEGAAERFFFVRRVPQQHVFLVSGIFSSSKPPFSERAMHITMKQQGAFGRCPLPRLPQGRIRENPYHRAPTQLSTYFELPSGNLLHSY